MLLLMRLQPVIPKKGVSQADLKNVIQRLLNNNKNYSKDR